MIQKFSVLLLLIIVMIQGCAERPKVDTRFRGNFDFSAIESYSLYERNSSFSEFQNISDSTRNSIEIAIEKALDKQGYIYKNPEEADVIVGYHIVNKPVDLKRYNAGVRYNKYRLQAGAIDSANKAKHLNTVAGSIILDLVDTRKKQSIWRGVGAMAIDEDDNPREVQQKIHAAIALLLMELPLAHCKGVCA